MDATDQITGKFTCQRATRRWSKATFENLIDLSVHNSYVLFCWANPENNISKRQYIEWLAKDLAINNVRRRKSDPKLHIDMVDIIDKFIDNYQQNCSHTTRPTAACDICRGKESLNECYRCKSTCCSKHSKQR